MFISQTTQESADKTVKNHLNHKRIKWYYYRQQTKHSQLYIVLRN